MMLFKIKIKIIHSICLENVQQNIKNFKLHHTQSHALFFVFCCNPLTPLWLNVFVGAFKYCHFTWKIQFKWYEYWHLNYKNTRGKNLFVKPDLKKGNFKVRKNFFNFVKFDFWPGIPGFLFNWVLELNSWVRVST